MVAGREYSEGKEKEKIVLVREIRAGFSARLRYPNVQCLNVDFDIPVRVVIMSVEQERDSVQPDWSVDSSLMETAVNICGIPLPREPHYSNSILKL